MKHLLFLFTVCILFLTQCSSPSTSDNGLRGWLEESQALRILCSTEMIEDFVAYIGQEHVHTLSLIGPGLDPHSYELVKGDSEKLMAAEFIFYNGLGLEHGSSLNYALKNHPHALAVGDWVYKRFPKRIIVQDGVVDPHIWMDVSLWSQIITPITEQLSKLLPEQAASFQARALKLKEEMQALHEEIKEVTHRVPAHKRYLVSSHDAFQYFTLSYLALENERGNGTWEKRCQAPEGISPEGQVSLGTIQEIIDHIQAHQIHVIFAESSTSQDSIRKILNVCQELNFPLEIATPGLYSDCLGPKNSEVNTYAKMVLYNARTISKYLNH